LLPTPYPNHKGLAIKDGATRRALPRNLFAFSELRVRSL
jgi:hypothetical protein